MDGDTKSPGSSGAFGVDFILILLILSVVSIIMRPNATFPGRDTRMQHTRRVVSQSGSLAAPPTVIHHVTGQPTADQSASNKGANNKGGR